MLHDIVNFVVDTVGSLGYIGIFLMMFLESSFFPFPSEVVMVPAGYLAYKGEMNIYYAIISGVAGSLTGALFNYFLAVKFGRAFLVRYGKYFFIKEETITKMDEFFKSHGHISTFSGRLIPAVRQYISFPAGLARMNLLTFSIYTTLGAAIWVVILTLLGYYLGDNEALIKEYLRYIIVGILICLSIIGFWYYKKVKKNQKI
ncbi:MAG: DedA family protein [Arcobacter sp.]|nr:DedA family protein [Arcobacter sp.]|tara:strand:- start:3364 stop:3969 length:606 start_codon:yes stop_codon:yes gene_type:complete